MANLRKSGGSGGGLVKIVVPDQVLRPITYPFGGPAADFIDTNSYKLFGVAEIGNLRAQTWDGDVAENRQFTSGIAPSHVYISLECLRVYSERA